MEEVVLVKSETDLNSLKLFSNELLEYLSTTDPLDPEQSLSFLKRCVSNDLFSSSCFLHVSDILQYVTCSNGKTYTAKELLLTLLISSMGVKVRSRPKPIKIIDLSACRGLSGEAILKLLQVIDQSEDVAVFNISFSSGFTPECARAIASCLPELRHIDISYSEIDEASLTSFCSSLVSHLVSFVARGCNGVSASVFHSPSMSSLRHVDVSCCPSVNSSVLKHITSIATLTSLLASWCGDIGDALSKLPKTTKSIELVSIAGSKTGEAGVSKLLSTNVLSCVDLGESSELIKPSDRHFLENAKKIVLTGEDVSNETLLAVVRAAPRLRDLEVSCSARIDCLTLVEALRLAPQLRKIAVIFCEKLDIKSTNVILSVIPDDASLFFAPLEILE